MKFKRIISALVSASMIIAAMPIVSYAGLVGTDKAVLKMVILTPDQNAADGSGYSEAAQNSVSTTNGEFYVGVKAEDFSNITEVANYSLNTSGGLNDISFGIVYDSNYITFEPDFAIDLSTDQDGSEIFYDGTSVVDEWKSRMNYASSFLKKSSPFTYNYTAEMIEEVDAEAADKAKGYNKAQTVALSGSAVANNMRMRYSGGDDCYLAIIKFKFNHDASALDGKRVLGFTTNATSMSFGLTGTDKVVYQTSGNGVVTGPTQDFLAVVDFDDSAVDFFPANAVTVTDISKKSPATYTVPAQYTGKPLDIGNLVLQTDMSDGTHTDIAANDSKLSFAYADASNITDATSNALTAISGDFASAMTNKYLYAVYDGHLLCLGQFSVTASGIDTITLGTGTFGARNTDADANTNYYTTETIGSVLTGSSAETLPVNLGYNNGDTDNNVAVASYGSKGVALYRSYVDAGDGNKVKVEKVVLSGDNATRFNAGDNDFYVALSSVADGTELASVTPISAKKTVVGTADTTVITKVENAKLKYDENATAPQNKIDFDNADITTYTMSNGAQTASAKKVSANKSDYIFYLGDDNQAANNAYSNSKTVIQSGTTPYVEATHKDKYVWVVPADNTSATPILVGQLTNRAIDTTPAVIATNTTANPPQSVAYGKTLEDARPKDQTTQNPKDLTVTLHYDNGDTETYTLAEAAAKGIKARIVSAGQTPTTLADNISNTTPLTTEMSGGKIQFYTGTAPSETVLAEATVPTITKAPVKVQITSPTTSTTKVYDGGVALPAGASAGTIVFAGFTTTDDAKKANIAIEGLTFQYDAKDVPATANTRKIEAVVGQNGLSVKRADGKTTADIPDADITALNNHYSFELDTTSGFTTANGKTTVDGATADITPLALKVESPFPSTAIGDATAGKQEFVDGKTGSLVLSTTNSNIKTGDSVTLGFTYKYKAADIGSAKDPADVDLSNFSLTGNQSGNYLVTGSDADGTAVSIPATAKGKINNQDVERIAIHNNTLKTEYTYPDLGLDLSDLVLDVYFKGASQATPMDLPTFLEKGTIALSQNKGGSANVGIDGSNKASEELPYGQPTLTFTYNNDTQHKLVSTLDVGKKPISLKDLLELLQPTMTYDGTDEKTFTITSDEIKALDPDLLEGDDEFEIEYTAKFAAPDADHNVEITVNKIKPVSSDGDSDNYVIINDVTASAESKTPVDDNTTLTSATVKAATGEDFTGDIEPQPLDTPAAPTVTLSASTNNITVDTPKSDASHTYAYSKDGGATWQTDPTFTDLAQDTEYTILVREVPQDGDNNHTYSETSSTKQKTYTYKVVAHRSGKTTTYTGYTNDTTVTSDAEIHAIVNNGTKPSGFKAYYSDEATSNKIEYNPTYAFAYTNKVADIYYTASSGGGGGGGGVSTYTVKFDTADGGVISSGKSSVSVASGSKVAETAVPTITAKTGYNFIGWSTDGSTVVDPTEATVTKSVTYTALYEEIVVPTNTPAPQPTDTPVIDENYTKPYASGYEDGTFRPDGQITRAELAAMIARLSYGDDLPNGSYYSSFSDVDNDAWFTKYVGYLEDKDVLSGYEDGTFRPYNPVTRGEISAVITRAQRLGVDVYTGQYTDVTEADWARDYIQTLANNGIASGYEDGTFGPYNPLTRAEAVTMINKVLAPSEAVVTFTPNDIYGHWAYDQILLAVNERRLTSAPAPAPTEEPAVEPEATEEPAADEATTEVTEEAQDNTTEEATDTTDETTEVVEEEGNSAE